jgi:hypothetical protein
MLKTNKKELEKVCNLFKAAKMPGNIHLNEEGEIIWSCDFLKKDTIENETSYFTSLLIDATIHTCYSFKDLRVSDLSFTAKIYSREEDKIEEYLF